MQYQLALSLPDCSGRGVRFSLLSPADHDDVMLQAAKRIGPEGSLIELKKAEWREGVMRMVKEVTVNTDCFSQEALLRPEVKWRKVTYVDLEADFNESDEDKRLLQPKDWAILTEMYRSKHDVSLDEVKLIQGKVLAVSTG